ncbi:hypothetical protein A11Q_2353 [Pseudobdellovibrio exovorus JSS]|uniref:Outer membrane protein beta-barrel domain-containing protein n=2 Tax=Pseudobdellovibrio exovorus TaxID=453816 RepID=M4VTP5_9BACT|nr:hypothetical protein A11Q_2353 [Pseudobdellovibrio exovorus JSS]
MLNIKMLICFFLLGYSNSLWAYTPSEGNISTYLGPYFHKSNFETTASGTTSPILTGWGLVVLGDVNERGSLEVGIHYLNKYYYSEQNGIETVEKNGLYHVTMGYRWWFKEYLSASLSFFSAYSSGDPVVLYTNAPVGSEVKTSAHDTVEYGVDLAVQFELWNQGLWGAVLDTRYSYSVTPKPGEKADHYAVMLGLRYTVQEKFPESSSQVSEDQIKPEQAKP